MQKAATGIPEHSSNQNSAITDFRVYNQPPAQEEDPFSQLTIRKRKYGTRWKQQNLSALRQNFDLLHILILYISLGLIFMSIGGLCYYFASIYPEIIEVDYTRCKATNRTDNATSDTDNPTGECFPDPEKGVNPVNRTKSIQCTCQLSIDVQQRNLPVNNCSLILYYKLMSFHQNTRPYKKDVDWDQLEGFVNSNGKPTTPQCKVKERNGKPIYPCGKIANSYFSDSFKMFDPNGGEVKMDVSDIAWTADEKRYKNPSEKIEEKFELPPAWHPGLVDDFLHGENKGVENPRFMVWMRAAAFDKFRKKYAEIKLETGKYTIEIEYRYEVKSFKGTKKIVIAADDQDRPVDFKFFYCYMAVGGICLLIGPLIYITSRIMNAFHKSSSSSNRPSRTASALDHSQAGDRLLLGEQQLLHTSQNEMQDTPANTTGQSSSVSVKT